MCGSHLLRRFEPVTTPALGLDAALRNPTDSKQNPRSCRPFVTGIAMLTLPS